MPIVVFMQLIYGTYGFNASSQLIANIILAIALSFLLGFCQWQILETFIMNAKQWMWTSFVGGSVGLSAALLKNYAATNWETSGVSMWLLNGIIIGIALGIAQYFFLRHLVKFSGIWILANVLGWSIGLEWGWSVFSTNTSSILFDSIVGYFFYFAVSVFCFAITYTGITGVLLFFLLQFHSKKLQTSAA